MSAFLTHVWTSTLFLAAVMIAARLLPLTARTRYVLLLAGLFKFAVPPFAFPGLPRSESFPAMQWLAPPALVALPAPPAASTTDWRLIALIAWIASAALLALVWAVARRRLINSALAATSVAVPRERQALTAARHALRLRTSIDIRRSTICEAPAVVRVIRPVVVLPDGGCDQLDDSELESLLRHECAHVARRDNLVGLVESAVVAAFWFHPLVWLAQRAIAAAREEACDEMAAATGPSSVDTFVSALNKICSALVAPRLAGVSCMASAHLKERLNHLMAYETLRHRALPHRFVTVLATVAVLVIAGGSGISAPPQETGRITEKIVDAASTDRYRLHWSVRPGETPEQWTFRGSVVDSSTNVILTQPTLEFRRGGKAKAQATTETDDSERTVQIDIRDAGAQIEVTMRILENGAIAQTSSFAAAPRRDNVSRNASGRRYTGDKISLQLRDADIKDVLRNFAMISGMKIDFPPDLQGRVTLDIRDMPWDEAFDVVMRQHGLSFELKDGAVIVK
jgi:beta-lactamase regulating signal transducer with metallopeptidase domain